MNGAEALVDALRYLDVSVAFGLPGVHNLAVWEAAADRGLRIVGARHEQGAAYAADGLARATGRLGVALVTTGPGAANTVTACGEALASGSPIMVIATEIHTTLRRPGVYRGVLHESRDQQALFTAVTKHRTTVADADDIGPAVVRAAHQALAAPQGPVYVAIPTDLLRALSSPGVGVSTSVDELVADMAPDDTAIAVAAALIAAADRPLIWAGGGAQAAGAGPALDRLARHLAAPVVLTTSARGLLAPDHPCLVPGSIHVPEIGAIWDEADLVIAVGTDFDGMMTQNWLLPAPRRMVAINVDAADATKNYPGDVVVVADARTGVEALNEQVQATVAARPLAEWSERRAALEAAVARHVETEEPRAAAFVRAMAQVLPDDTVVVADLCIPAYWYTGFGRVAQPRGLQYPMGWGTLGFALPAAIGAAVARPQSRVVCLCGDGGLLFACGELAVVREERLSLTVIVVDDGGYGMLRFDQKVTGAPSHGVDLFTPDFAALAAAFDIPAQTVTGFGADFAECLRDSMAHPGPSMLVVKAHLEPPVSTSLRWYRRGG